MAQDDIFRASIDVQSILDNRRKEPENDSLSCDVQGEAPEKVAKPRGPYKTKEKVKRVSFFSFFVIYFSHLKLIQSNFSLFAFSLNALFATSSLHAAAI